MNLRIPWGGLSHFSKKLFPEEIFPEVSSTQIERIGYICSDLSY